MDDDIPAFILESFKRDKVFTLKRCCINLKVNVYAAVFFFRGKRELFKGFSFCVCHCGLDFLAGCFVHDFSCDRILFSGDKVLINKLIFDRNGLACGRRMASVFLIYCRGVSVRDMDCLGGIVNVLMDDHGRTIVICPFEHDNICPCQCRAVKCKADLYLPVFCGRGKCDFF